MLHLKQLCKHFNSVKAFDQVGLIIEPGEMVGVIGRSGAGKSTLLRLINWLIDPTSGRIEFGGTEIGDLKGRDLLKWRSRCAMIFQQFSLVNRLDVLTNVLVGRLGYHRTLPTLFKVFSKSEKAMAIRALDMLDMRRRPFNGQIRFRGATTTRGHRPCPGARAEIDAGR
jgi:phosphonate transport system ATP-binding protein